MSPDDNIIIIIVFNFDLKILQIAMGPKKEGLAGWEVRATKTYIYLSENKQDIYFDRHFLGCQRPRKHIISLAAQ